ncbi:hypothetical protein RSJ22_00230 (plasmid) [Clostridium botulinum]|uniref:hypothetical protein n=1 Tax=Clostridium botulinum TaxID=1491 RepID=UPI000C782703|nr:hypothetical protein [Clostridium botulinum]AUN19958.1 hypothetical protein RSJ22_00230 [Clostridium botulinum]
MATTIYKKINFVDRLDNKPTTYLIDGKEAKIVKDDSGVVTHGTNLDQENLDHVENGILQNSRDISMLDRLIETNIGETTKEITELRLKDEEQQQSIDKMIERLTFMSCKRESKQGKYYTQIRWYRKDKTLYAYSTLYQDSTSTNEYIPKSMEIFFYSNNGSTIKERTKFDLIFNSEDGDLIEMRLV